VRGEEGHKRSWQERGNERQARGGGWERIKRRGGRQEGGGVERGLRGGDCGRLRGVGQESGGK